ncbi:hypothetical protein PS943_04425 [Pseudomonas fluorescens]|uniref:Uncharacterized protein n=1 Tax=Pseudomonas fluorescens TaxID=294 RepID=A0A5E7WLV4_PSEFL|nr:hypothetical protein PS943_04425 [Pseudomonas fluorescens]
MVAALLVRANGLNIFHASASPGSHNVGGTSGLFCG